MCCTWINNRQDCLLIQGRRPANARIWLRVIREWSHKDGGHVIQSAISENRKLHGCMTLCYRTGVIADGSFTLWEWGFSTFLLMWPWPWPDDAHIRTWPYYQETYRAYRMCENEFPTSTHSKVIACRCVHLVTRGHFRSRDKDGGHNIWSAIAKTSCYTQNSWLYVSQNRSCCQLKFYIAWIRIFDLFLLLDLDLDPITFIYELDLYSQEI